jgi:hypothetical protein
VRDDDERSRMENDLLRSHEASVNRMRPIRFSEAELRAMSDAELNSVLNAGMTNDGTLYQGAAMAITTELNRRHISRATKPHKPTFWWTIAAGISSIVAAITGIATLWIQLATPQPQAPAAQAPALGQTAEPSRLPPQSSPPNTASETPGQDRRGR